MVALLVLITQDTASSYSGSLPPSLLRPSLALLKMSSLSDAAGEQVFDVIGFAELFKVFHHAVHFFVGSERTVYALRIAGARRQEQHVTLTEQVFRTHLVEDGAAVDFARHLEGDAGRNIGF